MRGGEGGRADKQTARGEKEWQGGGRNAVTSRKGEGLNEVLLMMREEDKLDEHAAPGPISVCVREGSIRFTTRDGEVAAGPQTVLPRDAGVSHAIEAPEDAVCVVTTAGGRTPPAVVRRKAGARHPREAR